MYRVFRWLLLAFIAVPLIELYLLIGIGQSIGFWPTVALTLVTGVVGSTLARREGLRVLQEWRAALNELRSPAEGILEGLMILVAGALLITPGIITDTVGFLLLIPGARRAFVRPLRRAVERHIERGRLRVVHSGEPPGGFPFYSSAPPPPAPTPFPRRSEGGVVETTGEAVGDGDERDHGGNHSR